MLRTEFLVNVFAPIAQRVATVFAYLLGAAFFLVVLVGSFRPWPSASCVTNEFEGEGALHVPVWPTPFHYSSRLGLSIINYLVMAISHLTVRRPTTRRKRKAWSDARSRRNRSKWHRTCLNLSVATILIIAGWC